MRDDCGSFRSNNQQAKAANKAQTETEVQTRKGPISWIKTNGICDNYEKNPSGARSGKKQSGAKFVDKNKDGVCDNYQSEIIGTW